MARTHGEPPRQHTGPLPMECDYSKKLNGRCPADSPRLPIYNEPEISATERQRGGKHAYTQEKPARNALETRACRAMNAMGSLSRSRRGAPARGKVDSPLFAIHDQELVASGAGAGGQQTGRPGRRRRRLGIRRPRRRRLQIRRPRRGRRQTRCLPQRRRRRRR